MKTMILLLAMLVNSHSIDTGPTDTRWKSFKVKYGKNYDTNEDKARRVIYEDNLRRIDDHNKLYAAGLSSFYLGENQFADWKPSEFSKRMNGHGYKVKMPFHPKRNDNTTSIKHSIVPLPEEVNWVKQGYVTEVKRQDECRADWAFSTTGALEGAYYRKTGRLISLSEKNLMDCSWGYGNQGCNGGTVINSFQYTVDNKGIDTENSYPYEPYSSMKCRHDVSNIGATISEYKSVSSGSELDLQIATATVGPISVVVDADHFSFIVYQGGIYDEPFCSHVYLDRALLVVGYGTERDGRQYWLVKNSMGPTWGEHGYIKMSRNKNNQCGIASRFSYPIV